jgi:hypothetical protein
MSPQDKDTLDSLKQQQADVEAELRSTADEQRQNELRGVHKSLVEKIEELETVLRGG